MLIVLGILLIGVAALLRLQSNPSNPALTASATEAFVPPTSPSPTVPTLDQILELPFPDDDRGWTFVHRVTNGEIQDEKNIRLSIQFLSPDHIGGNDGCNEFCMSRTRLAQTMVLCPESVVTDQEGNVVETLPAHEEPRDLIHLLQESYAYVFDAERLEIYAGSSILHFTRGAAPPAEGIAAALCNGLD